MVMKYRRIAAIALDADTTIIVHVPMAAGGYESTTPYRWACAVRVKVTCRVGRLVNALASLFGRESHDTPRSQKPDRVDRCYFLRMRGLSLLALEGMGRYAANSFAVNDEPKHSE